MWRPLRLRREYGELRVLKLPQAVFKTCVFIFALCFASSHLARKFKTRLRSDPDSLYWLNLRLEFMTSVLRLQLRFFSSCLRRILTFWFFTSCRFWQPQSVFCVFAGLMGEYFDQPACSIGTRGVKAPVHGQAWFMGDYFDQPACSIDEHSGSQSSCSWASLVHGRLFGSASPFKLSRSLLTLKKDKILIGPNNI